MRARGHGAHADDAITSPKLDTPGAAAIPCDAGESLRGAHVQRVAAGGLAAPLYPQRQHRREAEELVHFASGPQRRRRRGALDADGRQHDARPVRRCR